MDEDFPCNERGRQRSSRKRACEHYSSEDENFGNCKKQRTSGQEYTGGNGRGGVESSSCNSAVHDRNDLFLSCPTNQVPTLTPKNCSGEIDQTDLCKPDFDYQDLCNRLLFLEAVQNDSSMGEMLTDESSLESDLNSEHNCNTKHASTCHSEENLPSLSIRESTFDINFPACAISCTSIKDTISENRLTPVGGSSDIGLCSTPTCLKVSSVDSPYVHLEYLQWCAERERQRSHDSDKIASHLVENKQADKGQINGVLQESLNNESVVENAYNVKEAAPSCSKLLQKRCYTLMCITKIEPSNSMDETTGREYMTSVSTHNLPLAIFNSNPEVDVGAKFIGVNNPEVISCIDYYKTAFGTCHMKSGDMGMTQVLLLGINPNGENVTLGSVCPSCKLVVAKDGKGTRRVMLHIPNS